jgi:multiple sugar transport system substrate-binding protein
MPFAWQAGAEIAEEGEFTLGSDAMVEAMEYYQSFFEEGLADPQSDPTSPLEVKMVDEKIGSFISGPWHIGLLREQGGPDFEDKWDVAVMPTEEAGTSFVGGSNLAVFKDASNRDAAWKFVAFLMQPDVQQTWYETVTDLPSVQEAWESGTLSEDPRLATFGQQLEDAKAPPSFPTWEQVASVIDGQIEAVVKGGEDPAAAVEAIQTEATSIGTGTGA